MEVHIPYNNPANFIQSLRLKYSFPLNKSWNANILKLPDYLGEGNMQVFVRENMHFIRSKWRTFEPSIVSSPDDVKLSQHIDFRISESGNVESAFLRGCKKYEWEITRVNGLRLFLPKECLPGKTDLLGKLNKYCIDKNVEGLLRELMGIYPEDAASSMLLEGKFLQFIHLWIKFLYREDIEQYFEDLSDWHLKRLKDAKDIIEQSIDNPCGIKALSKKVSINEYDLKKGFKKVHGLSIHQYVIKLRMEKARDLILNTDRPVYEICSELGYTNRGHFAQLYLKYFGMPPLQHRMQSMIRRTQNNELL